MKDCYTLGNMGQEEFLGLQGMLNYLERINEDARQRYAASGKERGTLVSTKKAKYIIDKFGPFYLRLIPTLLLPVQNANMVRQESVDRLFSYGIHSLDLVPPIIVEGIKREGGYWLADGHARSKRAHIRGVPLVWGYVPEDLLSPLDQFTIKWIEHPNDRITQSTLHYVTLDQKVLVE